MWAEDDLCPAVPSCLDSYIAPIEGKVYRMYHGTSREAAVHIKVNGFKRSSVGMLGSGVYLSRDLQKASKYPLDLPENQRVVLRVKVNVGKVIKINYQGHPLQKTWHDYGYDTAWCPPNCGMVSSGLEEDCVWDPKRITLIDEIPPCLQSTEDPVEYKIYTMFYGTTKKDAEKIKEFGFRQSGGILRQGVYLSRHLDKASTKINRDVPIQQRSVLKVKVNFGKVIKIDNQGHPMKENRQDRGYDTAWCPIKFGIALSGLDRVWNPRRIAVIDVIRPK
ncbi:uncharacterized protein LOC127627692 isoform X1 [Xyrauchen texanus]|nr:uncharacterized protein LOC127627692 isoform X1 [Xyrauchen texanus]